MLKRSRKVFILITKYFTYSAEYLLADPQLACEDMNDDAIVAIDTLEGCKKAVHDLDINNPDVNSESIASEPKGCYVYTTENKLYFNEHPVGLSKTQWSSTTRKVCFDWDAAMDKTSGIVLVLI